MITRRLRRGQLHRIADAPVMQRNAYALLRDYEERDGVLVELIEGALAVIATPVSGHPD